MREWLTPKNGRTPAVIINVAHLDDEERTLVLGVLPPHPANPPTKCPTVALMKQGRAFGIGVVVATQNPMDLDYRHLQRGLWAVGRLQTDADRERVCRQHRQCARGGQLGEHIENVIRQLQQPKQQ